MSDQPEQDESRSLSPSPSRSPNLSPSRSPSPSLRPQTSPDRPVLPPRPSNLNLMQTRSPSKYGPRPQLVSDATTAVSMTDVNTYTRSDGTRESRQTPSRGASARSLYMLDSNRTSDIGEDNSSIRSYLPIARPVLDNESIFGGGGGTESKQGLSSGPESDIYESEQVDDTADQEADLDFQAEFEDVEESGDEGEEEARRSWKAKRKHFIILSAAGKPIYTRHGSDSIVSTYVGIIQTIISSYNSWDNELKSFSANNVQFVVLSQTNLYLVAISSLPESESQLRAQLEALYMQILSTLTLPTLTHLFANRPSTDLRRPLQGTEVLLSALADSFTRGSPSTLLSSLECLRIRKSHRQVINNTLIKARVDDLLYGLIVADGRLVSVIRPKKHSLHPSDLQLIFNMLFEAEGIKAGGGDSWIPICLPGFNKTGYLYMYVSFLDMGGEAVREVDQDEHIEQDEAVAIILLSPNKESLEDMQSMKNYIVHELRRNGSMKIIQAAVHHGRPLATEIVPGTVLRHFLYKSKGNVQFFMPSYHPYFPTLNRRRQLMSVYHALHASVHAKHAAVKVQHNVGTSASSLAWITPMFELYCVASPQTSRHALAQSANKVVQWVQREEERIFLIGGAGVLIMNTSI